MKAAVIVVCASVLLLAGCGGCNRWTDAPYITPPLLTNEEPRAQFFIRFSAADNTEQQIIDLIASQCAGRFSSARLYDQGYGYGTVPHPHQAQVVCGDPPPETPTYRGQEVDSGRLIDLSRRSLKTVSEAPMCER
ncbi:hypothetical protein WCLP8_3830007 [uncultured Gammaproteobacteria bacterium]